MNLLIFVFGCVVGCMLLEPLIINFVYFSNIDLFNDIILTKKNSCKLRDYYYEKIIRDKLLDYDFWGDFYD